MFSFFPTKLIKHSVVLHRPALPVRFANPFKSSYLYRNHSTKIPVAVPHKKFSTTIDPQYLQNLYLKKEMWDEKQMYNKDAPPVKFPFGLWFRGQQNSWDLTPGIFRNEYLASSSKAFMRDETSMFHHFRILNADHRISHQTTLEWITLMQHHGIPTRLLDWTENVLVALYFAVGDKNEHLETDGLFFILHAYRLNRVSSISDFHGIGIPETLDAAIRAEFARLNSFGDIQESVYSSSPIFGLKQKNISSHIGNIKDYPDKLAKLAYPYAFIPNRITPRMQAQAANFTLHGGKKYYDNKSSSDRILPIGLVELNQMQLGNTPFLKAIKIPKNCKTKIANELSYLGINRGAMFPNSLDHQSYYIRQRWMIEIDEKEGTDNASQIAPPPTFSNSTAPTTSPSPKLK